jgi:hypothetical protein
MPASGRDESVTVGTAATSASGFARPAAGHGSSKLSESGHLDLQEIG